VGQQESSTATSKQVQFADEERPVSLPLLVKTASELDYVDLESGSLASVSIVPVVHAPMEVSTLHRVEELGQVGLLGESSKGEKRGRKIDLVDKNMVKFEI